MNPYLENILGNIEAIGIRDFEGVETLCRESRNGGVIGVMVKPVGSDECSGEKLPSKNFPLYDSKFIGRTPDTVLNEVRDWVRSVVESAQNDDLPGRL